MSIQQELIDILSLGDIKYYLFMQLGAILKKISYLFFFVRK